MADSNFTLDSETGAYVATVSADDVVNVHFERTKHSAVVFKQRVPSSGEWATTKSFNSMSAPLVFDENLVSDFYPINWRIESYSEVTNAILTE